MKPKKRLLYFGTFPAASLRAERSNPVQTTYSEGIQLFLPVIDKAQLLTTLKRGLHFFEMPFDTGLLRSARNDEGGEVNTEGRYVQLHAMPLCNRVSSC